MAPDFWVALSQALEFPGASQPIDQRRRRLPLGFTNSEAVQDLKGGGFCNNARFVSRNVPDVLVCLRTDATRLPDCWWPALDFAAVFLGMKSLKQTWPSGAMPGYSRGATVQFQPAPVNSTASFRCPYRRTNPNTRPPSGDWVITGTVSDVLSCSRKSRCRRQPAEADAGAEAGKQKPKQQTASRGRTSRQPAASRSGCRWQASLRRIQPRVS